VTTPSVQHSQRITQASASNLALSFFHLSPEKQAAMNALYAFCRKVDDIADEAQKPVDERRFQLENWRRQIQAVCLGEMPEKPHPIIVELAPWVAKYNLPQEHFESLIQGMEMDLSIDRYDTWKALSEYCYRVASAVGLLSIEIFGYQYASAHNYAYHLGQALQLTNILRDVRHDAELGRIYVPSELLERLSISDKAILSMTLSTEKLKELVHAMVQEATNHYSKASQCLHREDRPSMVAADLMGQIYWHLLQKISAYPEALRSSKKIKLHKAYKGLLVLKSGLRHRCGWHAPLYG